MAYRLDDVRMAPFPDRERVEQALADAGVSLGRIESAVREFVCSEDVVAGFGYQQSIADHLERHLGQQLSSAPVRRLNPTVSPDLNEKADIRLATGGDAPGVYFEIEFRPNVEKDLVKFQIAYNKGRLAVGVLIVAVSRARINSSYTTMPEFQKVTRLIAELAPPYPLLLVGIGGTHVDSAV